ncbi:hypothetical protein QG37_07165 [Candidozyma auris]|uniref:Uncharacterized protein n=1 Tax=Candidozyma auris TaxID=498019 RepID=A0A0L0NQS7_CANAR|nr:hypothetical protein QG37_07165 [[Candida] auris]
MLSEKMGLIQEVFAGLLNPQQKEVERWSV